MNIIDLRDIVENKEAEPEIYQTWKKALWDDAGYAIDDIADNEPTMIPADDFVAYAQELAEDIGAIGQDAREHSVILTPHRDPLYNTQNRHPNE